MPLIIADYQNTLDMFQLRIFVVGCVMACSLLTTVMALGVSAGDPSPYDEVTVFSIGESGYFCIKIPYLFTTSAGSLLAFGEARIDSCWDWAPTDLVFKKSTDDGLTWGPLRVLYSNSSTAKGINNTIGNAAPLQLRHNGRIVVPFTQNNYFVWQTTSDDDGETWSAPEAVPGGRRNAWQWVGTGPPGALQLQSGRLAVPSYHSYVANTDGDISRVHMMINDDINASASSWYIGGVAPGIELTNECQAVELEPNHLLITTHGVLTQRMQIESFDGGITLQEPYYTALTSPLGGCEGSIAKVNDSLLIFSGTTNENPERYNMTIWTSATNGTSWTYGFSVNPGKTAYSSLSLMPDGHRVGLLYERSNSSEFVFLPTAFSFLVVFPFPQPKH